MSRTCSSSYHCDGKTVNTAAEAASKSESKVDVARKDDAVTKLHDELKELEVLRSELIKKPKRLSDDFDQKYPDLTSAQAVRKVPASRYDKEMRLRVLVGAQAIREKAMIMVSCASGEKVLLERSVRDAEREIKSNEAAIASKKFLIGLESKKLKEAREATEKLQKDVEKVQKTNVAAVARARFLAAMEARERSTSPRDSVNVKRSRQE